MIPRPARLLPAALMLAFGGCTADANPSTLDGTYMLVTENGHTLPTNPYAPFGCCITLTGSLTLDCLSYDVRASYRNVNNGILFDNSEQGTFTREGDSLRFVRTGGGGQMFPYLLAAGVIDGNAIVLRYGDEGPGSNQVEGVFRR